MTTSKFLPGWLPFLLATRTINNQELPFLHPWFLKRYCSLEISDDRAQLEHFSRLINMYTQTGSTYNCMTLTLRSTHAKQLSYTICLLRLVLIVDSSSHFLLRALTHRQTHAQSNITDHSTHALATVSVGDYLHNITDNITDRDWLLCEGQTTNLQPLKLYFVICSIIYCITFASLSLHSVCLSVIPRPTAYHDWSITTKFGRQVYACPRTRVSLFESPISHTLGARGKNMQNFAYAYSCHCERDASCHTTCQFSRESKHLWIEWKCWVHFDS